MSNDRNSRNWRHGLAAASVLALVSAPHAAALGTACDKTTQTLNQACQLSARDDQKVGTAICLNIRDSNAAARCQDDAQSAFDDALSTCGDMQVVRQLVCRKLGGDPYDPVIVPSNFVRKITNPYMPFQPERWWEYRANLPDGTLERDRVEVLDDSRVIQGVTVTTVRDRVWMDGELVEDTLDWFAQDKAGNVWYFGEIAKELEDGVLVDIDGSWESGRGGGKAGIAIKAVPKIGEYYRQEFDPDNAEDMANAVDLDSHDQVPFRNGNPVLKTHEFSALDPGSDEYKYYEPGVGLLEEVDPGAGEVLRLVDYGTK